MSDWLANIQSSVGHSPELPGSVIEWIGLLLGLHKALERLTPMDHTEMAKEWFLKAVNLWGLNGTRVMPLPEPVPFVHSSGWGRDLGSARATGDSSACLRAYI
jgi:hypothetical protein